MFHGPSRIGRKTFQEGEELDGGSLGGLRTDHRQAPAGILSRTQDRSRAGSRQAWIVASTEVPSTKYGVQSTMYHSVLPYSVLRTRYSVLGTPYSVLRTRY